MSGKMNRQVILCDMCTEEDRKPARKTCMKCEISMCVQHLQAHLTTPVFIHTHPLTEPKALSGSIKCGQHDKPLEYYCLDDLTCVCVSCAIEDQHRLHNMKTFSTAHKELMEKLNAEQQALLVKTDDENLSLEKWEKSEREKLGRCSVRLIEAVTNLRDIALTSVQSSVSARMVSIKTSKSSMQAAQKEKDSFRFLQMYSQVHQDVEKAKAVDLRKGLEPGSDRDKLVQEIREKGEKMVKQAGHLCGSLLTLVDPENHQEAISSSSDLIFDPQILGPGMSLSEDNRKVFYSSWLGQCSAHMFHFQNCNPTRSDPSFQSWVISLSNDFDWTIGLCDKNYAKGMNYGDVYGLCFKGDQLRCLTTDTTEIHPSRAFGRQTTRGSRIGGRQQVSHQRFNSLAENVARPREVEVVWSPPYSLSFFSRIGQHHRRKIVTLTISSMNSYLDPFVSLEENQSQKSLNKSRIISSSGPISGQQRPQMWRCSCGMGYNEISDEYSPQRSSQAKCSCGKLIGPLRITKVLCELL